MSAVVLWLNGASSLCRFVVVLMVPLDEVIGSSVTIVIVSRSDGPADGNTFGAAKYFF